MRQIILDEDNRLKHIVLNYLQGEPISVVRLRLQTECAELRRGCRDLYKKIAVSTAHDPYIHAILKSLNIAKSSSFYDEGGDYERLLKRSSNLYELLNHLYHDGHHQVGYLLQLIEDTKPSRPWTLIFIFSAFSVAGFGVFFHFNKAYFDAMIDWVTRTFPRVIDWLSKTFTVLKNIPLLGIIYNGLGLLFTWYRTFANGTSAASHKISALFFTTLTSSLTITAYALTYATAGTMMLPVAILFFVSSSIDVFKSIYTFFHSRNALNSLSKPDEHHAPWESLAEYERAQNLHQRSLSSFWIKLSTAILTTTAVGIWSFFPPNLLITIACVSFISLVSLSRNSLLRNMYEHYANRLQRNIQTIETLPDPDLTPYNQASLLKLQRELDIREEQLVKHEQALSQREKKLAMQEEQLHASFDDKLTLATNSLTRTLLTLNDNWQQQPKRSKLFCVEQEANSTGLPFVTRALRRTKSDGQLVTVRDETRQIDPIGLGHA